MKKILVVTSGFPLYASEGLNVFMLEFVQTIAKKYEVIVLAPYSKRSKHFEIIGNIKVYRHNQFPVINAEIAYGSGITGNIKKNPLLIFALPFYFFLQVLAIRKIVKKHKIEIINAHWIIPQGVTSVIYKKLFNRRIKIVSTIHGSDFFSLNNFIGNFFKKMVLKNSDAVAVVSQALKDAVLKTGFAKEVHLGPMGVDTNRFSPQKRDEKLKNKLGAESGFLLYVGGLIEGKGVKYLVKAMPGIVKEFPKIKLLMVGEGYLENELKSLAKTLEVENNIMFAGVVSNADLPPYFASADAFILPSFSEGFPVVIKEAMSCGTICLVTDLPVFGSHPVLNEVLFKVRIANSPDIEERIIHILNNRESLQSRKLKSREFILNYSGWDQVSKTYGELIKTI